jgi:GT2 family glycosyltransferase
VVAPSLEVCAQSKRLKKLKKTAIVILNWNGQRFLEKFLPQVVLHSSEVADVIIADNASTDNSLQWLAAHYPNVRVLRNIKNYGFAQGYNEALKKVPHDYYILLNSDIEVTANWIQPLFEMMESDRLIAACQPVIRSWHQKNHFEYAGAAGGFIDHFGYPFCRGRIFQEIEEDCGQYNDPAEIFWATGACIMVRASLYQRFGGFDDDFFAHMEEIDFCWRMKNAGYKIMFCPGSVVYHVGGGTLPKKSSLKTYLNFRNNLTLIFKNIPSEKIFYTFLARWVLDWIAALKFLLQGGISDFLAVLRAHWFFIFNIGKQIRKRRKIFQSNVSGIYKRNIVIQHFAAGKKHFSELDPDDFSR